MNIAAFVSAVKTQKKNRRTFKIGIFDPEKL